MHPLGHSNSFSTLTLACPKKTTLSSGSIIWQDTFSGTQAIGIESASRTPEKGVWVKRADLTNFSGFGVLISNENKARASGAQQASVTTCVYQIGLAPTVDHVIKGEFRIPNIINQVNVGVVTRLHPTLNTMYGFRYFQLSGTRRVDLFKIVSGTFTILQSAGINLGSNSTSTFRFEVRGSSLTGVINGTNLVFATDTDIPADSSYYAGVRYQNEANQTNGNDRGIHIDNYVVELL